MFYKSIIKISALVLAGMIFTGCTAIYTSDTAAPIEKLVVNTSSPMVSVTSAVTIDNKKTVKVENDQKVIQSWEEYKNSEQPLLSALPEKGIYLYDIKNDKIMLKVNENKYFFNNWICLNSRFILPRMQESDFDNDGKNELAVILYVGSGSGFSVEELHILEIYDEQAISESLRDYVFKSDDYVPMLKNNITFKTHKFKNKMMGEITINKQKEIFELRNYKPEGGEINTNIIWNNIVHFDFQDNRLIADFGAGIAYEKFPSPDFIGDVFADVSFEVGKFTLKNYRFEELRE